MSALDVAVSTQLQKRLLEQREKSVEVLGTGTCKDFSEYRYSCGYLKAIDDALLIAAEIIEDMQRS